ncbi:MAG: hypothetical protein AAFZ15_03040 [Bacteroidota bacterium]
MTHIDYITIIKNSWMAYDDTRSITDINDISARVSTNHVYKVVLADGGWVIAKLSYFGKFEHFVEDHTIINVLNNNLPAPFDNFLARSLMKGDKLFVHRFQNGEIDAWVVFYLPVKIVQLMPKRLTENHIQKLATEIATFHKTCHIIRHTMPPSSKTLSWDIRDFLKLLETDMGRYEHRNNLDEIKKQCYLFLGNIEALGVYEFDTIPVFVDWNIGNFSVTPNTKLYSRWDYDWFRISNRMMDFYFFSRVVSDIGDRSVFSYTISQLMEDRFLMFLKHYHEIFPLTENEILFLKEAYRFFILNYVVKNGRYFFHEIYATKLQKEAFDIYFPQIDTFDPEKLLKVIK